MIKKMELKTCIIKPVNVTEIYCESVPIRKNIVKGKVKGLQKKRSRRKQKTYANMHIVK